MQTLQWAGFKLLQKYESFSISDTMLKCNASEPSVGIDRTSSLAIIHILVVLKH